MIKKGKYVKIEREHDNKFNPGGGGGLIALLS